MKIRPYIILERALISFAISAMLGYVLVSVIERYTSMEKIPHTPGRREEISPSSEEKGSRVARRDTACREYEERRGEAKTGNDRIAK